MDKFRYEAFCKEFPFLWLLERERKKIVSLKVRRFNKGDCLQSSQNILNELWDEEHQELIAADALIELFSANGKWLADVKDYSETLIETISFLFENKGEECGYYFTQFTIKSYDREEKEEIRVTILKPPTCFTPKTSWNNWLIWQIELAKKMASEEVQNIINS